MGVQASTTSGAVFPSCDKNPTTAGLLTIFLGGLGVGRFYYGYVVYGVLWLLWTLFAHISMSVARVLGKGSDGKGCCGIIALILGSIAGLSEIGCFVLWVRDL